MFMGLFEFEIRLKYTLEKVGFQLKFFQLLYIFINEQFALIINRLNLHLGKTRRRKFRVFVICFSMTENLFQEIRRKGNFWKS